MNAYIEFFKHWAMDVGAPENVAEQIAQLAVYGLLGLVFVVLAYAVQRTLSFILDGVSRFLSKKSATTWDDVLCDARLPSRVSHLLVSILCIKTFPLFFTEHRTAYSVFDSATNIYFAIAVVGVVYSLLNAVMAIGMNTKLKDVPVKGFFQAVKLVLILVVGIWILSILSNKSPAYFLSGLGALMAVLLFVFKDALLGFTAGIMISANRMVLNGDWIEMPSAGADGDVVDVSLTTVKVQNWDKTITTIPAYSLISGSFKNWRGMSESGGRRIKRSLVLDMQTIHFATEEEIGRWLKIEALKPYLLRKIAELKEVNSAVSAEVVSASFANRRHITNIGTFRAYCAAYLKGNRKIHNVERDGKKSEGMTLMVRQLAPDANGLPLEIYAFTNDTNWAHYEDIQGDIFDHLLAILPEFNLRIYQNPSGKNFEEFLTRLRTGVPVADSE